MAAVTWKPSTNSTRGDNLEVRLGGEGIVFVFEQGIVQDIPIEFLAALQARVAALGGTLGAAPTCSLVITGGAAGAYSYQTIPYNDNGDDLPPAATSTAVGPTTLDGTHFIDVNWTAVSGVTGYKIRRVTGGPSQGLIGVAAPGQLTFRDNGVAASVYTPSGANPNNWGLLVGSPSEV
jgi:hypothetical protein